MVHLDGKGLTLDQVIAVARGLEKVSITEQARARIDKARSYVDCKADEGAVIYGVTTGFGKFSDTFICAADIETLQHNLIKSHACALGEPLNKETVRTSMLLRLNA
ncbi:MAG TPA: aromatic amino acid lyase, partial [Clostridia bacterium]|nr:aromatic amino acid lyase [Clostridia bacterium]